MKLSELLKRLENIKNNNAEDIDVYFVDDSGDFIGIYDVAFNYPDMISDYRSDILFEDENISDEKISSHIIDKYSFDLDGTLYPVSEDELRYSKPVIAVGGKISIVDKNNKPSFWNYVKISESYKIIKRNNMYYDNLYFQQQNNDTIKKSDDYKHYLALKEKFKDIN